MGGLDAVVFTGGIGENSVMVRSEVCKNMEYLGIELDDEVNSSKPYGETLLSRQSGKAKVYKIPTNEELVIALDTEAIVREQMGNGK
jgi:acetate kinase